MVSYPFARRLCLDGGEEACPQEAAASPYSKTARMSYGFSCSGMQNCQAFGMCLSVYLRETMYKQILGDFMLIKLYFCCY